MAIERLLIVAPNWLGDAVMALPAIADLRRAYPSAAVIVAARPAVAPLFALVPDVQETVLLAPAPRRLGAWREVGSELTLHRFDAAVLLPNSFHAALAASRAGIPERWGYRTDWRGRLLTRAVARPASGLHQVEYYQQLVQALGFAIGPGQPRIEVTDAVRAAGEQALVKGGWDRRSPLVAIAPGAAYGGAKRWPPEYFADLANGLARDGVTTAMLGSGADEPTGREIEAGVTSRGALLNLIGGTDLAALAGVLALTRGVVSNDSGAMHLAAALGARVTALFGPTSEAATAPRGPRTPVVLSHTVWCRPCLLRECPIDHRCMRGLDAARVLAATRTALRS